MKETVINSRPRSASGGETGKFAGTSRLIGNPLWLFAGLFLAFACIGLTNWYLSFTAEREVGQIHSKALTSGRFLLDVPEVVTEPGDIWRLWKNPDKVLQEEWHPENWGKLANQEVEMVRGWLEQAGAAGAYPAAPGTGAGNWYVSRVTFTNYADPVYGTVLFQIRQITLKKFDKSESHFLAYEANTGLVLEVRFEGEADSFSCTDLSFWESIHSEDRNKAPLEWKQDSGEGFWEITRDQ